MSPVPTPTIELVARQIWAIATATSPAEVADCYDYRIHAGGSIVLNNRTIIPLTEDAYIRPNCSINDDPTLEREVLDNAILDVKDPWYASTSPVLFVLGMCLTISWVLLIMLLITPRTFFHAPTGYGIGQMRMGSAGGSIPIIGIGNRPWFQKVATFTVAVSLLLATIRAFDKAADQYNVGILDSLQLTSETLDSKEVLVIRFISSMFEWLAQAQTALRLFQRHREKVVIKWVALTLIFLEMIFGILNSFTSLGQSDVYFNKGRPRRYSNAIPAVQYLFEMALSLMYAAVVLYYSFTKRRYAFYHPKMKNICLVALLAIVAITVPVVFFVLDIATIMIASWGDYVRWVGAAAASVLVWEWVERIEALERDDRKDGILGREIFEGDEMLDNGPGPDGTYKRGRKRRLDKTLSSSTTVIASSRDSGSGSESLKRRSSDHGRSRFPRLGINALARIAALRQAKKANNHQLTSSGAGARANRGRRSSIGVDNSTDIELERAPPAVHRRHRVTTANEPQPNTSAGEAPVQPPPVSPSPISRSDCTSASASTVYRVVHHPVSPTSTPGISETLYPQGNAMNVASPSPDLTKGKKRKVNMVNFNPFRKRSDSHTPETLETQLEEDEDLTPSAQEGKEQQSKPGKSGFFSRFRRDQSEERELPPLVIPWRGDDADANPGDFDLEAGLGDHGSRGETSHNRPFPMGRNNSDAHIDPFDNYEETPHRPYVSPSRRSPAISEFPHNASNLNVSDAQSSNDRRPP